MALDFSQDYLIWDTYEAGTLTSRDNAGNTDLSIARAHRNALTRREIEASQGAYRGDDIAFHLPTALLGSTTPKSGDYWTDADSVRYNVLIAIRSTHKATWRIICRNPIIAYGLRDTGHIYRPVIEDGRVVSWQPLYLNLRCRLQPAGRAKGDGDVDQNMLRPLYRVPVAIDVPLARRHDQFRGDNGLVLEITAVESEETLDNLSVLVCEKSL